MRATGAVVVVAPSLTPIGYNIKRRDLLLQTVVAPSLTPIGYNPLPVLALLVSVVAPSLTPIGYNSSSASRQCWLL